MTKIIIACSILASLMIASYLVGLYEGRHMLACSIEKARFQHEQEEKL